MKTETIKQSIISNYKILALQSKNKKQGNIVSVWGLNYKQNNKPEGFVNELGLIQRKSAKIELRDDEIKKIKKPFFSTWKKTLENINTMLEQIIVDFDNPNAVSKTYVNIVCFPKELAERLEKINRKIHKR